jgi:hypothetical protein
MASSAIQNCRASTKNTCPPGMFAAVETVTAQSVKNSRLLPPSLGLLPVDWGVKVTRSMNLTLRLRARLETARLARRDISSRSVCNLTEPQRFVIKPTAGGAFGGRSAQRMEEDRAIEGMKNPYITANGCSLVGAYCFLSSALSALLRGRKNP